jgi:transcription elongation GreA/GreB family factor
MSLAFVREDSIPRAEIEPDRPISAHPNLVTPNGLALIERELDRLAHALAAVGDDEAARARLLREQRYWQARRGTAQLVHPDDTTPGEVCFGSRVRIRRGGKVDTVEIVGEDEADPAAGKLSYVSPIAAALMGAMPGETVEVAGRTPAIRIEVLAVK